VLSVSVSVASAWLAITNPADARAPATNAAILAGRNIVRLPEPTLIVVSSVFFGSFISAWSFNDDRCPGIARSPTSPLNCGSLRDRDLTAPLLSHAVQGV